MKSALSLCAIAGLATVNACIMDICAINGGCTTVTANNRVFQELPGGNPPYVDNLSYAKIVAGSIQLDHINTANNPFITGTVLTIENTPALSVVAAWACVEI